MIHTYCNVWILNRLQTYLKNESSNHILQLHTVLPEMEKMKCENEDDGLAKIFYFFLFCIVPPLATLFTNALSALCKFKSSNSYYIVHITSDKTQIFQTSGWCCKSAKGRKNCKNYIFRTVIQGMIKTLRMKLKTLCAFPEKYEVLQALTFF